MKKKKQIFIYKIMVMIVAVIYVLTPTYGGSNIGSKLLINAMGIDGGEGVTVTIEAVGKENEGIVGEGADVRLAINQINSKKGQYTEISHCGLIVLGSEITTEQAMQNLLQLLSEGKINSGVSVVIASGSAKQFIEDAVKLSSAGGMSAISKYVTYLDSFLNIGVQKLVNFVSQIHSPSGIASLPIISIKEMDGEVSESSSKDSNESSGSGSEPSNTDDRKEIVLEYTGRTFGTHELILPSRPNRIYDILANNLGTGIATLENFEYDGIDYGNISGNIVTKNVTVKMPELGKVTLDINLKLNLVNRNKIVQLFIEKGLSANELYREIECQYKQKYLQYAQELIDFTKEYSADLLGLQNLVHKYYNDAWTREETIQRGEVVELSMQCSVY